MRALLMAVAQQQRRGAAPSYPAILNDGNTMAWYDSSDLTTITKDSNDFVSRWNDKLLSGRDLIQTAAPARQPKWVDGDGVLFDGSDDGMKAVAFTLNQPTLVYAVMNQLTWVIFRVAWDGNAAQRMYLQNRSTTPRIALLCGHIPVENDNLTLNTWRFVLAVYQGASSSLKIGTVTTTGNPGTNNAGGFALGSNANITANWNGKFKEIIIRRINDAAQDKLDIEQYLLTKYGL